jgi:DNA-binding response OmpR family regulator
VTTPRRVLFVDDEASVRESYRIILQRHGFAVTLAATVEEAFERIASVEFDLLICDLNIHTARDGYEVIRAMRAAHQGCTVMALTGFPDAENAGEGVNLWINGYIIKPVHPDELIAAIAERLAARQQRARILSLSYDEMLLRMRHMILESAGYAVVSAHGLVSGLEHCRDGGFDAFILGHSIPKADKRKMMEAFRQICPAPIISLRRGASEQMVDGADFHIEPDPELLLKLLADVVPRRSRPVGEGKIAKAG